MAQQQLEVPFYMKPRHEDQDEGTVQTIESFKKRFKLGKFTISAAETARGLQYWSNIRMKQVNEEKIWTFDFGKPKVGFLYGEYTQAGGHRFFGSTIDFDVFKTHLFPTGEYVEYLKTTAAMIIKRFKEANRDLKPQDTPTSVADNACLVENPMTSHQSASRLIQRIDTFPFEKNWTYQGSLNEMQQPIHSMDLSSLSFTLKYVRLGEQEESSRSGGMCFQMPLSEYINICENPAYIAFCEQVVFNMPNNNQPKLIQLPLKRDSNGEILITEENFEGFKKRKSLE